MLQRLLRLCISRFPPYVDPEMIARSKQTLRARLLQRRLKMSEAYRDRAAAALVRHALSLPGLGEGVCVAGYLAMRGEIDPTPLIDALVRRGCRIALPAVTGEDEALEFRAWTPGTPLEEGRLGTRAPPASAGVAAPDIVIVPLVAFDREGYRLGLGGGYYDRTLEQLRAGGNVLAAGIAFDEQEVDTVPGGSHDQRLDWIVTPSGAFRIGP